MCILSAIAFFFFFNDTATTEIYTLSLHDALPFSPLRRWVQERVDRRFNRRRYDAARTVEGFAAHLRDHVDLDTLSSELLAVVHQTVQPTQASLWLRPSAGRRTPR